MSDRQWRLLACAWVRWLPSARRGSSGAAVELAERFADGRAGAHELASARYGGRFLPGHAAWAVCWAPEEDGEQMARRAASWVMGHAWENAPHWERLHFEQDIAGPPGGRSLVAPAWRAHDGGQVVRLAREIYEARAWESMPVLGDALEEAGCSVPAVLEHCRHGPTHVRGCWVVDAVLGLG